MTFPAVKFELTRSYTSYADGTPKVVEDTGFAKQVKILSSAEVQAAYEAAGAQAGAQVSLECVFDNLDLYAPNGTDYLYTVTELKDGFLEGFDTWAVKGIILPFDQVATASERRDQGGACNSDRLQCVRRKWDDHRVSGGKSRTGDLRDFSDAAVQETQKFRQQQRLQTGNGTRLGGGGKDKVQLVLTKNWADFNAQFGTRPDTLELTLERKADAHSLDSRMRSTGQR